MCTCSVVSNSLRPHGLQPTGLLCPWDFPGKNTGVGCHFLLQGNLPDSGIESEPSVSPALQTDSLPLSYWGSPGPEEPRLNSMTVTEFLLHLHESHLFPSESSHTKQDEDSCHPPPLSRVLDEGRDSELTSRRCLILTHRHCYSQCTDMKLKAKKMVSNLTKVTQ